MSWLEDFKYRIRTEKPKQMQRLDDNTYYGGNLGGVTITKKRKKPYKWVSPRGAGNMTVMPGDPEMVFFAPIAAGAGIAASPAISSAIGSAVSGINTAGDALAATVAGQRLTSSLNFVGNAVKSSKAWPWIDAGLTSIFGAHGIDKVRKGDIHNVGDVVETGLDLLPLTQLARPIINTANRVSSTVQRGTDNLIKNLAGPDGKIFNSQVPFNENNYYRIVNGKEAFNDLINSGLVRGSESFNRAPYFGYGKGLWKTPSGRNATIIEATPDTPVEWTSPFSKHTPSQPVEYLKNPKQSDFDSGNFEEVIPWQSGSYQIPIEGFNFYRNYPLIGWRKVQLKTTQSREFPRGLISKEPLIARGVPEITVENAASITPEQWTAAQDAAIARGDMVEAQRLRDLHYIAKYGKKPYVSYRGNRQSDAVHRYTGKNPYQDSRTSYNASGYFSSSSDKVADTYNTLDDAPIFKLYTSYKKPYVLDAKGKHWTSDDVRPDILYNTYVKNGDYDGVIVRNVRDTGLATYKLEGESDIADDFISSTGRSRLADAVTYNDNGVRIPLGERDNFKLNDIRYNWIAPFVGLGTLGTLLNRKQQ